MQRWVVALLAMGAIGLGWHWLSRGDGAAVSPDATPPIVDEPELAGIAAAADQRAALALQPEPPAATAPAEPVADPAVEGVIAALRAGNVASGRTGWPLLLRVAGGERERLARALVEAAGRVEPADLLTLLGGNSAFVSSPEGLAAGRALVAKARRLPAEESALLLSRVVEACMRGPCRGDAAAARAFVDEAYAALREPLGRSLLNPQHLGRARTYDVKPGDVLERVAHRFQGEGLGVESGTLMAFNRLTDARRLRAGQVLKVPIDPIRTVIEKRSFLAAVYCGELIFRLYWVGHGRDGRTPEAAFTIGNKQERPDWYADGKVIPYGHPGNVLGDYFVAFDHPSFRGFGAHATPDAASIGAEASAGCIRMRDQDIKDFFLVVPRGSKVEICGTDW